MESTYFIARVISIIYLILGAGMYYNPKYYQETFHKLLESKPLMMLTGILALILGVYIDVYHIYWEFNIKGVVTVIGYIATFKGVYMLLFPKKMSVYAVFFTEKFAPIIAVLLMVLGGIFFYYGFIY